MTPVFQLLACILSSVTAMAASAAVFPRATWEESPPASLGLDARKLDEFAAQVGGDGCVIKDGYLVNSWGAVSARKDWASAAKPVLSTLLLLAVQEGKVPSVDAPVKSVGWELSPKDSTMTFRHLANMVSGYGCGEAPGAAWGYNDFGIQLYARSLEKVFQQSLDAAIRQRLAVLEFEDGPIFGSRNGLGVVASPRDFARLGWLWLNRGQWNGQPLVSEKLFTDCIKPGVPASLPRTTSKGEDYLRVGTYGGGTDQTPYGPGGYGFNFWFNEPTPNGQRVWPAAPADTYQANGMWNRDTVTIFSSLGMVVAVRGAKPGKFEPGQTDGEYNQNLKRLVDATTPGLFAARGQPASGAADLRIPRWQLHDFAFTASAKVENPFFVRFTATVTDPGGRTFTTPGFYDGDGTWKVRVAANQEGPWSLETQSELPELDRRKASFTCAANANPNIHGGLRVDSQHPHHFVFEDGARFYLLGYECDWLWALDTHDPNLGVVKPFLDKLAAHGFNYVILNTYAHDTGWRAGKTGDDDLGPPPLYAWEGTNEQPDHRRLNVAYWQHYDRVLHALFERGLMAHVFIKVYNKKVRWPAKGSPEDDLFFRWVAARYAAYPNVIWDFSKEAHNEKDLEYKLGRFRFLRAHDPYHHLITNHDDDAANDSGAYDGLNDFRADQQHSKFREKILAQRGRRAWPVVNVEFGYEHGPGGLADKTYGVAQAPEELVRRAWEIAIAGGYTAYYYTYTAWDVLRPEHTPKGYTYFKKLRDFFESTRYWELTPVENFVRDGWALANPGQEYVVFLKEAKPFTVGLPDSGGQLKGEWYHPLTGQRVAAGILKGGRQELRPPDSWSGGMAVLHLAAVGAKPD